MKRMKYLKNSIRDLKIVKKAVSIVDSIYRKIYSKDILRELSMFFDENDIHWFIDYGTLLGVFRDNKLIKDDLDIDFGVKADDKTDPNEISRMLTQKGFYHRKNKFYRGKIRQQIFFKKRVKIDIGYYYKYSDMYESYLFYRKINESFNQYLVAVKTIKDLDTKYITWKEINLCIPKLTNKYLYLKYGNSWNKRIKKKAMKTHQTSNTLKDGRVGIEIDFQK